jgi:hypothetical protein
VFFPLQAFHEKYQEFSIERKQLEGAPLMQAPALFRKVRQGMKSRSQGK